jgi:glutamine amidotransferase
MSPKIVVVDYGIGNVKSIINAFKYNEIDLLLSDNPEIILNADGLVLPGVGAFKAGMDKLKDKKLIPILKKFYKLNRPMIGICLGMQLLFEKGEEFGVHSGLGFIKGSVKKISVDTKSYKLPHISWNKLIPASIEWNNSIFKNISQNEKLYFVHSFAGFPNDKLKVLSYTEYANIRFCSAVKKNNLYGVQFHPEKSGKIGLKIINNFIKSCNNVKK